VNSGFCVHCGAALGPGHSYCPRCGGARWQPPEQEQRPRPPSPLRPPAHGPGEPGAHDRRLRLLPYLFAAGAVFWLIQLAQFAAVLAAPAGRDVLRQELISAGIKTDLDTVLVVESVIVLGLEIGAAALHAVAYYGLRRLRAWGWVAAVIAAAAWSIVIVGIPILIFLFRRPTREACGIG